MQIFQCVQFKASKIVGASSPYQYVTMQLLCKQKPSLQLLFHFVKWRVSALTHHFDCFSSFPSNDTASTIVRTSCSDSKINLFNEKLKQRKPVRKLATCLRPAGSKNKANCSVIVCVLRPGR